VALVVVHRQYNSHKASVEGREPTLKGHVHDLLDDKNSEQYVKITKETSNWVGREYTKYTGKLCEAMKTQFGLGYWYCCSRSSSYMGRSTSSINAWSLNQRSKIITILSTLSVVFVLLAVN
jgi:hypothetical protein